MFNLRYFIFKKTNLNHLFFRFFSLSHSVLPVSQNKYLVSDFFIKSKSNLQPASLVSNSIQQLKMSLLIFSKVYIKKYTLNLHLKKLLKKKEVFFYQRQKTHQLITSHHNLIASQVQTYSVWYSKNNYQKFVFEDFFIRKYLNSIFLKSQKFKKIGGSLYILRTHGKLFIKFFYFSPIVLNNHFYSRLRKIGSNWKALKTKLESTSLFLSKKYKGTGKSKTILNKLQIVLSEKKMNQKSKNDTFISKGLLTSNKKYKCNLLNLKTTVNILLKKKKDLLFIQTFFFLEKLLNCQIYFSFENIYQSYLILHYKYHFQNQGDFTSLKSFKRPEIELISLKVLKKYKFNDFFFKTFQCFTALFSYKNPDSFLLARFICKVFKTLHKRHTFFLSFLKKYLKLIFKLYRHIFGIKIIVKGRLNGQFRKKKRILQIGSLPLSTLSNRINYGFSEVYTKYGVFGLKVWIFSKVE